MNARTLRLWTLALLFPAAVAPAHAQVKASERGGVHQTIDGTTITVNYSRPRARGRTPLFGGDVVHWDHVWTPGADSATTLEIDKPVTIQGQYIPVGKYSVWFVVKDTTAWEVRLDPVAARFHLPEPEAHDSLITFMVDVGQRDVFFETLTWSFPEIRVNGATLAMQWGTTHVPLTVTVESTIELTVSTEVAAPILGTYQLAAEGERPWWNRTVVIAYDSAGSWPKSIWYEREVATDPENEDAVKDDAHDETDEHAEGAADDADTDAAEEEEDDPPWEAALLVVADDWFTPAWLHDGQLWSATKAMTLEFAIEDGRATGFELRNRKDEVVAKATRVY